MSPISFTARPTPNPRAYKFVASREIQPGPAQSFYSAEAAGVDPVAAKLFRIPGVTSVLILGNFCSVTQDGSQSWDQLIPQIQAALSEAYG